MVAGPAALAVALILLPGWLYWRLQPQARTARTALSELFEILAAGAVATGLTCLAYVSAEEWLPARCWPNGFVTPEDLASASYVTQHVAAISLTTASIVLLSCIGVWLVVKFQSRNAGGLNFKPHRALWAENLRADDQALTVEMRDGRIFNGYIAGNTTDESGTETPTLYLSPPVLVTESIVRRVGLLRNQADMRTTRYLGHAVFIPGSEIVAVWRSYTDEDAIKAGADPEK